MPKKVWNKFVTDHPDCPCFVAGCSSKLPQTIFDKDKKKLPGPYALFQEWLVKNIKGDYALSKINGGFALCAALKEDRDAIEKRFPKKYKEPQKADFSNEIYPIKYSDADYGILAKELGYKI